MPRVLPPPDTLPSRLTHPLVSTSTRWFCTPVFVMGVALGLVAPWLPASAQPSGDTLRATLARAYLTVDRITSRRVFDDGTRASINRAFDRTTLQFFGGRFAVAAAGLDSLTSALGLQPGDAPTPPPLGDARRIDGKLPSVVRDSTGALQQAHAAATSRASLLTDVASTSRSIELFIQPRAHAAAVTREVEALRTGRNPYAGRSGDWWREIVVGAGRRVPCAGRAAVGGAFRRAGAADRRAARRRRRREHVRGCLRRRRHHAAGRFARVPWWCHRWPTDSRRSAFDSVVAVVRREYAVDSTRVYVVGHSMGAGITALLANARGARLAAVAALAGGAAITAADAPPALFMAGGVDPVIPAARVKAAADATRAAGRTMEYRELPSEGHTLIVGRVLPEAIGWLFTHRR
jgi:predicted esterase